MIKSITKLNVIKALQKETLKRKRWFHTVFDMSLAEKKKCNVCAIGAILRKMSFESWAYKNGYPIMKLGEKVTNNFYSSASPLVLIKQKNYLGALSCYFEQGATKRNCIVFVKKYFPKKLTLEIKEI